MASTDMFVYPPDHRPRDLSDAAADAQQVRSHNAQLILRLVWSAPEGVSRADLARRTGMSRSTVSSIVQELLDAGLLAETHLARSRSGRPPIVLAFRDDAFGIVGVEMGASHIAAVLCDPRGAVLHSRRQEFDVQGDPAGAMALMHRLVRASRAAGVGRRIVGLGLAVPCPLDDTEPGRLSRRILPAWADMCVAEDLYAIHAVPVFVDNDANLGALAESWWGAARETTCSTYIKVATGVGAGHVIDGSVFRGSTGIAGEIGHSAVAGAQGRPCRCGLRGCLEAEIGSASVVDRARERLLAGAESSLDPDTLTLAGIVEAAQAGDPVAVDVIATAGRFLGVAIANLLNLMNPAKVVLGGRLTAAGELLLEPARRAIRDRALMTSIERADVVLSELGDDHVAIGSATLVLQAALAQPELFTPSPVPVSATA